MRTLLLLLLWRAFGPFPAFAGAALVFPAFAGAALVFAALHLPIREAPANPGASPLATATVTVAVADVLCALRPDRATLGPARVALCLELPAGLPLRASGFRATIWAARSR